MPTGNKKKVTADKPVEEQVWTPVKADGEDGPLFLEIEQFLRPIGEKTTFETFEDMVALLA